MVLSRSIFKLPIRISFVTLLAAALLLTGCAQQAASNAENDQVAANRQYMSSVNQAADELRVRMESFVDAVSRNDSVTMRTQADNAYQVLDRMESLEAPEDLTELHDGYAEACAELRGALDAYIELYTQISAATEAAPFDYSSYAARIQEIQEQYSKGIGLLESTDKTAAELQK